MVRIGSAALVDAVGGFTLEFPAYFSCTIHSTRLIVTPFQRRDDVAVLRLSEMSWSPARRIRTASPIETSFKSEVSLELL